MTFVRPERLELYLDSAEQQKNLHAENDQLIVIISEETLLSPEAMMAMLDTYTSIEEIGPNGAGVTYRISR
ncbi:MAG: hypothetical protein IJQ12_07455 [Lachnospiraceae bacterium]|nr:hypothetical protein [Lachnospiraceae bacterium]